MAETSPSRSVRVVGIILAVLGVVFLVAGIATYVTVSIPVSDDAEHFAGKDVKGSLHRLRAGRRHQRARAGHRGRQVVRPAAAGRPSPGTVMTASFLQASLFTSVVAFGVAAFVAVMGVVLILPGWALVRPGRPTAAA